MKTGTSRTALHPPEVRPARRSWIFTVGESLRGKPLGTASIVVLIIALLAAIFAEQISPSDPYSINEKTVLRGPSAFALLGTDELGRDVASRLIYGARVSLVVALASVGLGQGLGAVWGYISGYFGGKVDLTVQRAIDVLMAFPTLVLALAIMAALGPSVVNVTLAIGIVQIPRAARVMRSATLAIQKEQYIAAAYATGCGHLRILLTHIVPNTMAPFLVMCTVGLGNALIVEGGLSFLGLGSPPPTPSWGAMLAAAQEFGQQYPLLAIYPGLTLSMVVLAANLLGDTLRDILDPRMKNA